MCQWIITCERSILCSSSKANDHWEQHLHMINKNIRFSLWSLFRVTIFLTCSTFCNKFTYLMITSFQANSDIIRIWKWWNREQSFHPITFCSADLFIVLCYIKNVQDIELHCTVKMMIFFFHWTLKKCLVFKCTSAAGCRFSFGDVLKILVQNSAVP